MRLLTQSGTSNLTLDHNIFNGELLNVNNVISPFISGLTGWKIGVIFALIEITLEVNLQKTIALGNIPAINPEDSSATRLQKSVTARNNSEKIGLKFSRNGSDIGIVSLKNYGIAYTISILSRFGKTAKMLNIDSVLTCELLNLGQGSTLSSPDYININTDYLFEVNGFQPNDELKINIDKLPIEFRTGILLNF
ncbi:hypothetical protein [Okeania sp. SIO2B3]|uniref:hypothetical protein n=1 Tax=Okeania sp. SIO2B3 TaxID=2607784 RepID=UPI0013BF8967|nr:hypothetical protein [Okeania sp. SIO2B3]NET46755.1 hypothetical protein [Okeania sp. SIO2B3]